MIKYDIYLDTEYLKPRAIPKGWRNQNGLSKHGVKIICGQIMDKYPHKAHAFEVTEWDYDNIGEDGLPELTQQLNTIDFMGVLL